MPQNFGSRRGPAFTVERFIIADGSPRYYVWAEWHSRKTSDAPPIYRLAAWLTPSPTFHFLVVEPPSFFLAAEKQTLLNVVDLGSGRTGAVLSIDGEDSREIRLVEYKDGIGLKEMHVFQSISTGE